MSRKEAHYNHDDWYYASHICRDFKDARLVIVWSVAERSLGAKDDYNNISTTACSELLQ
jgi:hypothetical protein